MLPHAAKERTAADSLSGTPMHTPLRSSASGSARTVPFVSTETPGTVSAAPSSCAASMSPSVMAPTCHSGSGTRRSSCMSIRRTFLATCPFCRLPAGRRRPSVPPSVLAAGFFALLVSTRKLTDLNKPPPYVVLAAG